MWIGKGKGWIMEIFHPSWIKMHSIKQNDMDSLPSILPIYLFQTVPEDGHFLPNPPKGNSTRVNDGPTSNPNSKTREPSFSMLFPTSMNYYQLLIASGAAFSEIVLGFFMLGPNRSLRCKNNHRQSSCEGTCCFCLLAFLKAADRFSLWSSPNDPTFKGFTYL